VSSLTRVSSRSHAHRTGAPTAANIRGDSQSGVWSFHFKANVLTYYGKPRISSRSCRYAPTRNPPKEQSIPGKNGAPTRRSSPVTLRVPLKVYEPETNEQFLVEEAYAVKVSL
jgi:hypothetical protein